MNNETSTSIAGDYTTACATFRRFFGGETPLEADAVYFRELDNDFGHAIDIKEELKRFHAWALDHGHAKLANPRHRFRSWLHRAIQFGNHRQQ